jgi:hypothetical protein
LTTPQTLNKVTTMTPTDDPAEPGGVEPVGWVERSETHLSKTQRSKPQPHFHPCRSPGP